MAGSIEMAFGVWSAVGPSNHILDGGPDPPMVRGNFGGFPPHWKASGLHPPKRSIPGWGNAMQVDFFGFDVAFYRITSISCYISSTKTDSDVTTSTIITINKKAKKQVLVSKTIRHKNTKCGVCLEIFARTTSHCNDKYRLHKHPVQWSQ